MRRALPVIRHHGGPEADASSGRPPKNPVLPQATKADGPNWKVRTGPDGLHLFNRFDGTNLLVDEIALESSSWSRAPRQVSIALTNICNLRCSHCYAPKSRATLNLAELQTWLRELDEEGCLGVGFGGGEPTLYPELSRLCAFAAKHTTVALTMTTHGLELDDELTAALRGTLHFVRVSMDGVGATYERIRGRPFSLLRERLRNVRRLSRFGINFVINRATVSDLGAAAEIAEQEGACQFMLLPERATARAPGVDSTTLTSAKRWAEAYSGPLTLVTSEQSADDFHTTTALPRETALRGYAHIDASRQLKPTSFSNIGVQIEQHGVLAALECLQQRIPT